MSSLDNISDIQTQALHRMAGFTDPQTARELNIPLSVLHALNRRKMVDYLETPGDDYRSLRLSHTLLWYITGRGREYLKTGVYRKPPNEE